MVVAGPTHRSRAGLGDGHDVAVPLRIHIQRHLGVGVRGRVVVVDELVGTLVEQRSGISRGHEGVEVALEHPGRLETGGLHTGVAAEPDIGGISPADEEMAVGGYGHFGRRAVVDDGLLATLGVAEDDQILAAVSEVDRRELVSQQVSGSGTQDEKAPTR